jgi:uncharacterized protein YybS (DUF2232 family)
MSEGELFTAQKPGSGGNARALAEGAMLTALTLILAVISWYVPILNIFTHFLFPAPLALLVLRRGFKYGCLGAVCAFLLSAMLLGLPQAVYLFVLYGFLGLFFGWCFRTGKKAVFTLLGGLLISCASIMLLLLFPSYVLGIGVEQLREMITAMFRDYALMMEQQGATSMMGGMSVEDLVEATLKFLPYAMFMLAMFFSFACYALLSRLLRRLGNDIPKLPPFREWRLDWRLLWILILALLSSSLGARLRHELLTQIGNNLLAAMQIIFLIYGLTVLMWTLWRFKASNFLRVLAILFTIQLFSGSLVFLIGVFDPLFDFRGRLEKYLLKREQIK